MSNKRDLKRNVNYVCSELFSEVVAASMYSDKVSDEDVKALLASILVIHNDYVRRVSHVEPAEGVLQEPYHILQQAGV